MLKKALLALGLVAGLAGTARAAVVSPTLSTVYMRDRSPSPQLVLSFTGPLTLCGATTPTGGLFGVEAASLGGGYAELDTWARSATSALLAGRRLVIETIGSGSACRIYSIGITL